MQQPKTDLTDGTVPGAQRSYKTFFDLHQFLVRKYSKNLKVPGVKLSVNPAWAITWFVGVTIYCTFYNYNSPPPGQIYATKYLRKKLLQ